MTSLSQTQISSQHTKRMNMLCRLHRRLYIMAQTPIINGFHVNKHSVANLIIKEVRHCAGVYVLRSTSILVDIDRKRNRNRKTLPRKKEKETTLKKKLE